MSFLFGSPSKSDNTSSNQAYGYLQGALNPQVTNGTGASNQLASLLGLNGNTGQNQAFQNWQNSTGYNFGLQQGQQAITGSNAAKGLLNSGATLKALDQFGTNYANTQYGNYFNQLSSLLGQGNQAAGVIGGAGQVSKGSTTGEQKGLIGGLLSSFAGGYGQGMAGG